MKIVFFAEFYPKYLADFDSQNAAKLAGTSYAEHLALLCGDFFGMFVSYPTHFRRIGWEAELIVANYYPLQQKWLDERKSPLRVTPENKKEIALAQIKEAEPDVFFIGSIFDYFGEFLGSVSKITTNILAWIACPYPANLDLSRIRCVLSEDEWFPQQFRKMGAKSERMLHAFDPDVLGRLEKRPPSVPLSFVGGLTPEHRGRVETLKWLVKKGVNIELWGYIYHTRFEKIARLFRPNLLEGRHHGAVWGLAMFQTLANSKVTLNFHIDISTDNKTGANQRVYEATGVGSLLLSDIPPDPSIPGNFKAGRDMVIFHSREELLELIQHYTKNEAEAAVIAKAGQKTCLESHGYNVRVKEFESHIRRFCDL